MKFIEESIQNYCEKHTTAWGGLFDSLREETFAKLSLPQMQVGLLEGRLLGFLVALMGAKKVVEVGTFSGFSGLAMASYLPDDGMLITCEVDKRATDIAEKHWAQSPHGKKIHLKMGPAATTIPNIEGPIDMAFVDADKAGYIEYWNLLVPKLKIGGLIVVDNVLWSGGVLNPVELSDFQIRDFNEMARNDSRVEILMLPVRDGIILGRKK